MKLKLSVLNSIGIIILTYGLIISFFNFTSINKLAPCFFMEFFNFPCPLCGSTRSIIALFGGEMINSVLLNPLIIEFLFLLVWLNTIKILDKYLSNNYYSNLIAFITKHKLKFYILAAFLISTSWMNNILNLYGSLT